jgi:hypothetical protein
MEVDELRKLLAVASDDQIKMFLHGYTAGAVCEILLDNIPKEAAIAVCQQLLAKYTQGNTPS